MINVEVALVVEFVAQVPEDIQGLRANNPDHMSAEVCAMHYSKETALLFSSHGFCSLSSLCGLNKGAREA